MNDDWYLECNEQERRKVENMKYDDGIFNIIHQ